LALRGAEAPLFHVTAGGRDQNRKQGLKPGFLRSSLSQRWKRCATQKRCGTGDPSLRLKDGCALDDAVGWYKQRQRQRAGRPLHGCIVISSCGKYTEIIGGMTWTLVDGWGILEVLVEDFVCGGSVDAEAARG